MKPYSDLDLLLLTLAALTLAILCWGLGEILARLRPRVIYVHTTPPEPPNDNAVTPLRRPPAAS